MVQEYNSMLTFNVPKHEKAYPWVANTTQLWLPPDTKELYNENLSKPDTRSMLEKYGWIDTPVEYSFNKYGFRCQEFDYNPSIMFLGCSYTLGIGLPNQHTFAQIVADKLSLNNYNLTRCGVTPDGAFKTGYFWIKKLRPKIVVYGVHELSGFEVYNKNRRIQVVLNKVIQTNNNISDIIVSKFYNKFWKTSSLNYELNAIKNIMALRHICDSMGILFIHFDLHAYNEDKRCIDVIDYGRDLAHYGVKTHKGIAEYLLTRINKLI